MKWVPLLVIGGGGGICVHLLQGLSLPLLSLLLRVTHGSAETVF